MAALNGLCSNRSWSAPSSRRVRRTWTGGCGPAMSCYSWMGSRWWGSHTDTSSIWCMRRRGTARWIWSSGGGIRRQVREHQTSPLFLYLCRFESWVLMDLLNNPIFPILSALSINFSTPKPCVWLMPGLFCSVHFHPNCLTPTGTLQSVRLGSELIFSLHLLPQILHILDYFFPLVGTICALVGWGKFSMWVWNTLTD